MDGSCGARAFDCWMHEHDIRDALDRPADNPDGRDLAAGSRRDGRRAWGTSRQARSAHRTGSRVAIELTGPLQRTIDVDVSGRARVVEDFGGDEPTATITMDGLLFARLAGGRTTVARIRTPSATAATQRRWPAGRRAPQLCDLSWDSFIRWPAVTRTGRMKCPAEGRWGCEGLNGFDFAHRIKGSVPVQARDHRKRRCNQLSADSNQRDFALAA